MQFIFQQIAKPHKVVGLTPFSWVVALSGFVLVAALVDALVGLMSLGVVAGVCLSLEQREAYLRHICMIQLFGNHRQLYFLPKSED